METTYYQQYVTSASTCTGDTWISWNATGSSTATTIWTSWNATGDYETWVQPGRVVYAPPPPPTPEQIEAKRQADLAEVERLNEKMRQAKLASNAAKKLFLSLVGKKQYQLWRKRGYHEVFGASGKRYRLLERSAVREMVGNFGDKCAATLCIVLSQHCPQLDQLIMQMLLLQSGEEGEKLLHKTANRTAMAA